MIRNELGTRSVTSYSAVEHGTNGNDATTFLPGKQGPTEYIKCIKMVQQNATENQMKNAWKACWEKLEVKKPKEKKKKHTANCDLNVIGASKPEECR